MFQRKLTDKLNSFWKEFWKTIQVITCEDHNSNELKYERLLNVKWTISEKIWSQSWNFNESNLKIEYFWEKQIAHKCNIFEQTAFEDITKNIDEINLLVKKLFIALSCNNQDFKLAKKITETLEINEKRLVYFHIYNFELHYSSSVTPIRIKEICESYEWLWVRPNCMPIHYCRALYDLWEIEHAERLTEHHKNIDGMNFSRYFNQAFFYLLRWQEKKAFDEYEKIRNKFWGAISEMYVDNIIDHLESQRKMLSKPIFDLWIIYLSYYYKEKNPYFWITKDYLVSHAQERIIIKRLKWIIKQLQL